MISIFHIEYYAFSKQLLKKPSVIKFNYFSKKGTIYPWLSCYNQAQIDGNCSIMYSMTSFVFAKLNFFGFFANVMYSVCKVDGPQNGRSCERRRTRKSVRSDLNWMSLKVDGKVQSERITFSHVYHPV